MDRSEWATHQRGNLVRTIAFWFLTLIIAQELLAGSIWALLRNPFDREQFIHLGYPLYMLSILGAWKFGGGVVILLPRLQRIKEWAYAGAVFDFSGAVASHLFLGDGPQTWAYPAILVAVTLASWALRPDGRRLPSASSEGRPTTAAWAVPMGVAAAYGSFLPLIRFSVPLPSGGARSDEGIARQERLPGH